MADSQELPAGITADEIAAIAAAAAVFGGKHEEEDDVETPEFAVQSAPPEEPAASFAAAPQSFTETFQPEFVQPEMVQPEMVQPEMVQPETVQMDSTADAATADTAPNDVPEPSPVDAISAGPENAPSAIAMEAVVPERLPETTFPDENQTEVAAISTIEVSASQVAEVEAGVAENPKR